MQFEAIYGAEQLPYLADHRIYDRLVLPTTAGLEAAIAAGHAVFGTSELRLDHLIYHEAMVMPDEASRLVQLILTPQGPHSAAFELLSTAQPAAGEADGRDDWRRHMSGVLQQDPSVGSPQPAPTEPFSAAAVQTRCLQRIAPEHYYPLVREMGLDYGPAFQGIQQLWRGDGEALSLVQLPPHVNGEAEGLHPAFLDACLHIYPALAEESGGPAYLPIGIERFCVYRPAVTEAWVHAICRRRVAETHTLTLDLHLYDTEDNPVAVLQGLSVGRLPPEVLRRPDDMATVTRWLYQVRWEAQPRPLAPLTEAAAPDPAAWLLFADGSGVGDALVAQLEQRGDHCHTIRPDGALSRQGPRAWGVNPTQVGDFHHLIRELSALESLPCRGVIYLWGLDLPRMHDLTLERLTQAEATGSGGALFLIQALAEARSLGRFAPKLWIVTRHAQNPDGNPHAVEAIQAPLWGLGRVVPLEYPQMWGGLIDLPAAEPDQSDDDNRELLAEILQPWSGEDQVILRRDRRFVARLVPLPADPAAVDSLHSPPQATYLITGGTGMLGLNIAQWLVDRPGACDLVLTSRRGAQGIAQEAIDALQAGGARVHVMQADMTVEADVQRVINDIQRDLPPLRGVVHCAGLLDDGVLSQMDWEKFTRVTAPKVQGAWLLHHYTQAMDLDFFVLSSSILSLTGSAGQANYTAGNAFLDALANHRRALGLPAMAINWGPWDDAGLATASGDRGKAIWQARGTQFIPPEGGMRVFDHLMHHPTDHAAVTITDWSVYLDQFADSPPFYAVLARQAGTRRTTKRPRNRVDIQSQLQQAAAG